MTPFQKVIKYGAIAFGFYLVFVIISAIIFGITTIFSISFGINTYKSYNSQQNEVSSSFNESFDNVKNLDIKLDVTKLNIKKSNEFKVEVFNNINELYCKLDENTLKIRDESSNFNWFNFSNNVIPEVVIYIPKDLLLENIEICTGVNESKIESLVANKIDIKIGVGKCVINNMEADQTKISGGAGETKIRNSKFNDLRLDAGIGKFSINSEILEDAKIHAGVGQLIINLQGNKDSYKVKTTTGMGSLMVDGKKAGDGQVIGNGNSYVKVEAGVGEVQVNFLSSNK